ncbi:unnamed protein product [Schistocephalus solidus]|uniref:Uncharacterized protein n=1 Tax=Schistocephalus solidus TaxID=70667 RepID=A0A183SGP8_SCHSO|nr:unnamed protein product [Schistocephalus solidus]
MTRVQIDDCHRRLQKYKSWEVFNLPVLSISPPEESIVQQLPAPRPRVHLRGLHPRQKAEEGVGQQETVFHTGSQMKEAVIVTATETMDTQRSSYVALSVSTRALKSPRTINLSAFGTVASRMHRSS